MKTISLTQGKEAIVDDEDYEYLNQWKWFVSHNGYAIRNRRKSEGSGASFIRMHRVIHKTPEDMLTDHINQDKLDNRRGNLRTANKRLNAMNSRIPSDNKSGYKGVHWEKWSGKWRVEIGSRCNRIRLGRFTDLQEAVKVRLNAEQSFIKECMI